jgi:hypothetical protein
VPTHVLLGLVDVETGGRGGLTSSAGAKSITQFMPGTRAEMVRRYKVDPYRSPQEALVAAGLYLRDLGYGKDAKHALAAYNGGPGNPQYGYAREVLKRAGQYKGLSGGSPGRGAAPGGGGGGAVMLPGSSPSSGFSGAQSSPEVLTALLSAIKPQRPAPPVSLPPAPTALDGRRHLATPEGYTPPPSAPPAANTQPSVAETLSALSQLRGPDVPRARQQGLGKRDRLRA